MELDIHIKSVEVEVIVIARSDQIKAFVDWTFKTNTDDWKIKGGTIRYKEFGSKKLLSYEVPAIRTRKGYKKALYIADKELYLKLCNLSVQKFCELSGELPNNVIVEEAVNIDDLPF